MKDNLFEMLLGLFEKTLTELKEQHTLVNDSPDATSDASENESDTTTGAPMQTELLKSRSQTSLRVFTYLEQMKLTKASYQFLVRMLVWEVIDSDTMEIIINQLLFSEARIVTLEETKWTIRNVLAELLDKNQLAFLDLVLYQKEEAYTLH